MNPPIYADFNGIIRFPSESEYEYLDLCGYGTIGDLNRFKIKLREGLCLTFFEPNDIEVDATVHFIQSESDKYNPDGKWLAKYKASSIRSSENKSDYNIPQLCFKCEYNFDSLHKIYGRQYNEICPKCGTSIMYPLMPPVNG